MSTATLTPSFDPSALPPAAVIGSVEAFLRTAVESLPPAVAPTGPGRPQILPSLCLWAGLLVCLVRGFSSQLALWRLLTTIGLWTWDRFPVCDQAVYNRLATADTAPLETLFAHVRALLTARLAPYTRPDLAPFASGVFALDQSTLDAVARHLPALRATPPGATALLAGAFAGLFNLRTQLWEHLQFISNPAQNEKVVARDLVARLPPGSLLLADLGYFSFAWFDDLTRGGHHWISRWRTRTSYTLIHTFYQQGDTRDCLIWLGAHRADLAAYAVRLVEFRVGPTVHRYLTNVLDPAQLSAYEIAVLYARRWDIELAFRLVKQYLHLHLLWSAKTLVVQQQLWAVLIIAQILHGLRTEIAGRAGVDPYEVSMALLVEYLPQFAYQGANPVELVVRHGIAGGFIRPSRRTQIEAPRIDPAEVVPRPLTLVLERTPRYGYGIKQRNAARDERSRARRAARKLVDKPD